MSNFSPYIYQMNELPLITINNINDYFENFTFLSKPDRNVYKLSLAQLIHYLVDFGIGYNSVCTATLTTPQEFSSTMYVNKHNSLDSSRPATVADLKEKLLSAVESLIQETVQENSSGVINTNNFYPNYLFTLDKDIDSTKLKKLTGCTYVEVEDFTDFPFTNSTHSYSTLTNETGYIPADSLLLCPNHGHGGVNDAMKKSIKYKWGVKLGSNGKRTAWSGHIRTVFGLTYDGAGFDQHIGNYWNPDEKTWKETTVSFVSMTPAWQFPQSVSCYPNATVYPAGTVNVNGGKYVSIRFPGRRYRLFKKV